MAWKSVLAAVTAVAMFSPVAARAGKFNKKLNVGDAAPDWSDLPGIDEQRHALADFKEASCVVVGFFSHQCHVSQEYAPRLAKLEADYRERGVKLALIDVLPGGADNLKDIREFAKEQSLDCTYLYDASQKTGQDYGVTHTPTFFVLNGQGKIVYMGAFDDRPTDAEKVKYSYVRDAVSAVLANEKPRVGESRVRGCAIEYGSKNPAGHGKHGGHSKHGK